MFYLNCFLLIISFQFIFTLQNNENKTENFIPSKEWQIVKPNQKIPPGLHVRSNFETGVTEAKILEDESNEGNNSGMILIKDSKNASDDKSPTQYTPEQLKIMLKNVKDDSHHSDLKNDSIEINGTKFRSYQQLKDELASVQTNFKTDLEIIRELMINLQTNLDIDKKVALLQDLEYYLHQIDNAQNFVNMGGLAILHDYIDGDKLVLKSEALRCLASALQGNAKVKVEAIKNGTLSRLLVQLQLNKDDVMINRIIVAVSSITRQFPIAQTAFINGGGISMIGKIFDHYATLNDMKIPLKFITLISDWLKERNVDGDFQQDMLERQKQFEKIDINTLLRNEGWCSRLSSMIHMKSDLPIDYYEKVTHAIANIYPLCISTINNNEIVLFLKQAKHVISQLPNSSEPDDFYIKDMVELIEQVTTMVKSSNNHYEL